MIPRIRGQAGEIMDGPDAGKWIYEISVWTLDGEARLGDPWLLGPFESREQACNVGRDATKTVCETLEKEIGDGTISGKFLDMKNGGVLRPWENHS